MLVIITFSFCHSFLRTCMAMVWATHLQWKLSFKSTGHFQPASILTLLCTSPVPASGFMSMRIMFLVLSPWMLLDKWCTSKVGTGKSVFFFQLKTSWSSKFVVFSWGTTSIVLLSRQLTYLNPLVGNLGFSTSLSVFSLQAWRNWRNNVQVWEMQESTFWASAWEVRLLQVAWLFACLAVCKTSFCRCCGCSFCTEISWQGQPLKSDFIVVGEWEASDS